MDNRLVEIIFQHGLLGYISFNSKRELSRLLSCIIKQHNKYTIITHKMDNQMEFTDVCQFLHVTEFDDFILILRKILYREITTNKIVMVTFDLLLDDNYDLKEALYLMRKITNNQELSIIVSGIGLEYKSRTPKDYFDIVLQ